MNIFVLKLHACMVVAICGVKSIESANGGRLFSMDVLRKNVLGAGLQEMFMTEHT